MCRPQLSNSRRWHRSLTRFPTPHSRLPVRDIEYDVVSVYPRDLRRIESCVLEVHNRHKEIAFNSAQVVLDTPYTLDNLDERRRVFVKFGEDLRTWVRTRRAAFALGVQPDLTQAEVDFLSRPILSVSNVVIVPPGLVSDAIRNIRQLLYDEEDVVFDIHPDHPHDVRVALEFANSVYFNYPVHDVDSDMEMPGLEGDEEEAEDSDEDDGEARGVRKMEGED
ncbi:hypothetical protein CPC08DRAFT_797214 [Agrocybe pediades]|nr:hypothetical protein CPC08DRAFT_797214 [Agrocybe pediades]